MSKRIPEAARPGESLRFPAEFYNLLREMAARYIAGDFAAAPSRPSPIGNAAAPGPHDALCLNDSGDDCPAFGALHLLGLKFATGENLATLPFSWLIHGAGVLAADQRVVVAQQAIDDDEVGLCRTHGLTVARVYLNSTADTVCGPADALSTPYALEGGQGAYPIVWKPAGVTGEQLCLVSLDADKGIEECAALGSNSMSFTSTVSASDEVQWGWPTPPGPYPRHPNTQAVVDVTGTLDQYITLAPGVYVVTFGANVVTSSATGSPSKEVRLDVKTTGSTGPSPIAGGRAYLIAGQNDSVASSGGGSDVHGSSHGTCAVLVKVATGNVGKLSLVRTQGAISCTVTAWATVVRQAELPA